MVGNTSLLVSPYQDTCGVSETCDFSEKEESTMRNNYSIHFQASYHYKGLQPRFLLFLCLRVWVSWCAGLGATVKVPRICTIPAQHQESAPALQRRSAVTGRTSRSPSQRQFILLLFTGVSLSIFWEVVDPLPFTAVNFHFGMNLYRRTLAILLIYIYAKK